MAGQGRRVVFHGSFAEKRAAVAKEREVDGFIQPTMIRGQRRYTVMTAATRRNSPMTSTLGSWATPWTLGLLAVAAILFIKTLPAQGQS